MMHKSILSVAASSLLLLGRFSNVLSQTTSTDCFDYQDCSGSSVSTDEVNCHGYYGCQSASIDVTTTNIDGGYGCQDATVSSTTINAFGTRALDSADAYVTTLLGYGYFSAIYSNISALSNTLNVDFAGLYGGYLSNVYCYEGDTCKIECGTARGCQSLDFYCYSGSTCYYNCDDDPNNCPTLIGGIGATIITVIKPAFKTENDGVTRTMSINANSHELAKSGLSFHSKIGLTDEKMTELLDTRISLRQEQVTKEIETGKMDSKVVKGVNEYFKSRGENVPNEVVSVLFKGKKGLNSYFSSKTLAYLKGILHALLTIIILALLVKVYKKWTEKSNKLLDSGNNRNYNNIIYGSQYEYQAIL